MPAAADAFDRARLAATRQHAAQRIATAAEAALEKARGAEREAVRTREAAEEKARASRAAADTLKPLQVSHKKQRTGEFAGPSSDADQHTTPPPHFTPEPAETPGWREWLLDRFRKHETEEQRNRAVPIEPFIGPLPKDVKRVDCLGATLSSHKKRRASNIIITIFPL